MRNTRLCIRLLLVFGLVLLSCASAASAEEKAQPPEAENPFLKAARDKPTEAVVYDNDALMRLFGGGEIDPPPTSEASEAPAPERRSATGASKQAPLPDPLKSLEEQQKQQQARKRGLLPAPGSPKVRAARPKRAPRARFVEAIASPIASPVDSAQTPAWRLRLRSGDVLESSTPLDAEVTLRLIAALRVRS